MQFRSRLIIGIMCAYATAVLLPGCGQTGASEPKDIVKTEETAGDTSVVLDLGVVTEDGTVQKYLEMVTPETIPMVLHKDGNPVPIVFELHN